MCLKISESKVVFKRATTSFLTKRQCLKISHETTFSLTCKNIYNFLQKTLKLLMKNKVSQVHELRIFFDKNRNLICRFTKSHCWDLLKELILLAFPGSISATKPVAMGLEPQSRQDHPETALKTWTLLSHMRILK